MQVKDVMERHVASIADEDSLGLALQVMLWSDVREIPVIRKGDGQLAGIIGERDILRAHQRHADENVMRRSVGDFMTTPAAWIEPTANVADAAARMADERVGSLLVLDDGRLVGLLTTRDVLLAVPQLDPERRERSAEDENVSAVMYGEPLTARDDESLLLLGARMAKSGVRHACAVDSDRHVVGIVSDRDVRNAVGDPRSVLSSEPLPERVARLRVSDAMTPHPRTVMTDEPVGTVLDALLTQRFGALPVVDAEQRLLGIVSYIDVLRYLGQRADEARAHRA